MGQRKEKRSRSGWISTAEQQPEAERPVIIYTSKGEIDFGGWFGRYRGKMRWFASDGCFANVTHWMEVPGPPVGEAGKGTMASSPVSSVRQDYYALAKLVESGKLNKKNGDMIFHKWIKECRRRKLRHVSLDSCSVGPLLQFFKDQGIDKSAYYLDRRYGYLAMRVKQESNAG